MTYDGIFEKCETLAELHTKRNEMRATFNDPISRADQDRAFKKRRGEIVSKLRERSFG